MIAKSMLMAHLMMCAYVFWSVFIRAKWLDGRAHPGIRLVFCVLGCVALLGVAWPIARQQWEPDVWSLALLSSICLVQHVTSARWRAGIPAQFLVIERRGRKSDRHGVAL